MRETIVTKRDGLSIFEKLLCGFIIVITVTGIGSIYSISQLYYLSGITSAMFENPLSNIRTILKIETQITKIQLGMKRIESSATSRELNNAIDSVNQLENELDNGLEITKKRSSDDRRESALLTDIFRIYKEWRHDCDVIIALIRSGNRQHAFIVNSKEEDEAESLHLKIEELENYVAQKAEKMLYDAQNTRFKVIVIISLIFLTIILISLLFGFFISKSITDSIRQLKKGMFEFSQGNLDCKVKVRVNDEIKWLANAFNDMVAHQRTAIMELKLHDQIMTNMAEGVILVGANNGIILYANRKTEEMFGYGSGEFIGKHICQLKLSADICPKEGTSEIREVLPVWERQQEESQIFREDGTSFWCNTNVSFFEHVRYGKVIIYVMSDISVRKKMEDELCQYRLHLEKKVEERTADLEDQITRRKQIEEQIKTSLKEKETLLQEIHHRVKNNMQVICSLLKLQSNTTKDDQIKEVLKESQNRIYAMSAVHETLHGSENLSKIDLKVYVSKISTSIFQTYSVNPGRVKLKIDIKEVPVSINQASPLGLIINELISNSLKYAFPDERKGEITVSMKNQDHELELMVHDDGVGMPDGLDWKNSISLSFQLVKTLVENQLDGTIDMESHNGTKFTIKFNTGA